MNKLIRNLERESGLDVYGLGRDRAKWESVVEGFAELIVRECVDLVDNHDDSYPYVSFGDMIKKHFGVGE
jgi:hypothetical protein